MRKTVRAVFKQHAPADAVAWHASILGMWRDATFREQRYAAIELAVDKRFSQWLDMDTVPVLEELVVDGAWWDYVDRIAPAGLGYILATEPVAMAVRMRIWAQDVNIWRRRAAILCQLGRKERTDLRLLHDCLDACLDHQEFFVQKAMGWALRDYARTDPDEVRRYVSERHDQISTLSRREALKHLA